MDKTYTVVAISDPKSKWKYQVTGFQGSELELQTVHADEVSKDIEVRAWEGRGYRRVDATRSL